MMTKDIIFFFFFFLFELPYCLSLPSWFRPEGFVWVWQGVEQLLRTLSFQSSTVALTPVVQIMLGTFLLPLVSRSCFLFSCHLPSLIPIWIDSVGLRSVGGKITVLQRFPHVSSQNLWLLGCIAKDVENVNNGMDPELRRFSWIRKLCPFESLEHFNVERFLWLESDREMRQKRAETEGKVRGNQNLRRAWPITAGFEDILFSGRHT